MHLKKYASIGLLIVSSILLVSFMYSVYYDQEIFHSVYHHLNDYPKWFLTWSLASLGFAILFLISAIVLIHAYQEEIGLQTSKKINKNLIRISLATTTISIILLMVYSTVKINGQKMNFLLIFIVTLGFSIQTDIYLGYLLFSRKNDN